MKTLLVTGSGGLIGSEVADFFASNGWRIVGIDNNMRSDFFGPTGDTSSTVRRLIEKHDNYNHLQIDIRNRDAVLKCLQEVTPNAIVHAAAQPSHDLAASRPFDDFDVNAIGTLNLLEATRQHSPEASFVYLSTNKVYGDRPNTLPMTEQATRWDFSDAHYQAGINETLSVDQSKHSLFGASKLAADVLVQEYGRYFGMKTCCLRGGCLTGPNHSGVELHGFLSYLIKCNLLNTKYTIFGYQGKQVRDNIHSYDVAMFIQEFIHAPRVAEIYNLGGGRENSVSILEAFTLIESISGKPMNYTYDETNRIGDHICYISDLSKCKAHYPNWKISKSLEATFEEIYLSWRNKL